ncbi:MAG: hypothetical protein ACXVY8_09665 [Gaiellaceae bacterium]
MSSSVVNARQEWDAGHRRLAELQEDPGLREQLRAELETVSDELRKRMGQTFTLAELAALYDDAERWAREAVAERPPGRAWARYLTPVLDSAFHLYARGATDFTP